MDQPQKRIAPWYVASASMGLVASGLLPVLLPLLVAQVSHRIAVMYAGNLVEVGTEAQVFREAVHPYTRGLLRSVPTLRSDRSQPLKTIEGTVPNISDPPPGCPFELRCESRLPSCAQALPSLVEVEAGHWARCPVFAADIP